MKGKRKLTKKNSKYKIFDHPYFNTKKMILLFIMLAYVHNR